MKEILKNNNSDDIIAQLQRDLSTYIRLHENVLKLYTKILSRLTWILLPLCILVIGGIASMIYLVISNRDIIVFNKEGIESVRDSIRILFKK